MSAVLANTHSARAALAAACVLVAACGPVTDPTLHPAFDADKAAPVPARPHSEPNPQGNLYWGDLHIHTSFSTDAYTNGVRTTPDDAWTFVKGGEIAHPAGYGIRLQRPLDFAAVTDHGEYMGVLRATVPDQPLNQRSLRDYLLNDGPIAYTWMVMRAMADFDLKAVAVDGWQDITRSTWAEVVSSAERHNDPGRFSAFIGYEWSSMPDERNLHRNVIYRGSKVPPLPFSSVDSEDPRELWQALEAQREQGMPVFAIPHNGNVSDGLMYDSVMYDGGAMTADYAARRNRNEPLSEIFQIKGSSETHPALSPSDEFAGFEIYDTQLASSQADSEPRGSYTRDALRRGLEMNHSEGFNPYRFGVIGSSDGHNASAPVEEDNYHGKLPLFDGSAALRLRLASLLPDDMPGGRRWSSGGLAAVWAEENTRGALFDAMQRRETYATSGPRISVRFYGGWHFPTQLMQDPDWLPIAQSTGVPMGGELPVASTAQPSFAVAAARDPNSGNLDRIQIVKGWTDAAGRSHEKVYDVAWSGNRSIDADTGKLPPVGNTVDASRAHYSNIIGAPQLAAVWQDPDFNPQQQAFYYARVIEIPTPRWSTYDAVQLGIEAPEPTSLRERAVTSAIWYRPQLQ